MSEPGGLAGRSDGVRETYRVLEADRLTAREVARRLDVKYHSATDWLDDLYSAGLIDRSERETGRRGPNPYEYYR